MKNRLSLNPAVTAGLLLLMASLSIPAQAQITVGGNGSDTTDSTSYSGSQSLTKIGTNTVTLTGNNTYTGGSFINSGILNLGGGSSSGGNFTVGSGSELRVTAASFWFYGTPVFNFTTNGGGTINTWGGVNFIMGGNANYTTFGGARDRIIGGSGINLNTSTAIFNVARGSDATTDLEVETTLWNTGNVVKTGNGIMTLTGANSYSGSTDIQAGTVVAANNSALGTGGHSSSTMTYIRDGATLALQGNISLGEHFHVWGAGVGGLGAIRNLSGNNALTDTYNGGPGYALRSDTTVGVDAGSLSISGFYESGGSYGLTKIGAGTLTLTTTNTYTGKTIVNAGTLVLGSGTSSIQSWSSDIDINNGSTVSVAGSRFDLSQTGAARTVTFGATGGNTFDSGTGVNLVDWAGNTFKTTGGARNFITGSSGLNINSGFTATLDVARGTDATTDLLVSSYFWNNGSIAKTGAGIATLSGNNIYIGTTTISGGTLQIGNGGTSGTLGTGNVTDNATLAFNRSDSHTVSNTISGTGSLVKMGGGTTTLMGDNTYTGGTFVNAGTLNLGAGSTNAGASTAVGPYTIGNGATLQVTAAQFWFHGNPSFNFTTNGGGTIDTYSGVNFVMGGSGTFTSAGGAQNLIKGSSGINLNSNTTTFNVARGIDPNADLLVSARIWNGGNIVKTGNGILTLTGTNDYTGTTTISAGTLQVGNGGISGTLGSGEVTNNATLAFNRSDSHTVSNTISGTGSLEKQGAGTATLTGSNRYSGTTTISAGTLQVGNGGTNGTLGSGSVVDNAALAFNRSNALTITNQISGSGSLAQSGSGTTILSGNNSYTGGTVINAGTLATTGDERLADTGAVMVNSSATFKLGGNETIASLNGAGTADVGVNNLTLSSGSFSGALAGSGDLYKTGIGAFTISGTSSAFTGDLNLQNGSVVAVSSTALNANNFVLLGAGSTFTVNQDMVLGGIDQNGGTINGTGVITSFSTITRSGAINGVLGDVSGVNSGVLKLGTGTTTIGAANTYTGITKVSEGTLALGANGSLAATSSAQIASGATLDLAAHNQSLKDVKANGTIAGTGIMTVTGTLSGSGTVNADTVIEGTHSPGNSPGIQTFGGNLTYQPGSTMLWQLADNTTNYSPVVYDQVIVGKDLTFNGGTTLQLSFNDVGSLVNWSDSLWSSNQSWTIYQVSGLTTGLSNLTIADYSNLLDASGNSFASALTGASFSISQNGQNVVLNYNAQAVPEPSTYVLFGLGALVLVVAYRRRRRS